jgi:hypothetical protein
MQKSTLQSRARACVHFTAFSSLWVLSLLACGVGGVLRCVTGQSLMGSLLKEHHRLQASYARLDTAVTQVVNNNNHHVVKIPIPINPNTAKRHRNVCICISAPVSLVCLCVCSALIFSTASISSVGVVIRAFIIHCAPITITLLLTGRIASHPSYSAELAGAEQ